MENNKNIAARLMKVLGLVVGAVLAFILIFVLFSIITEFRPDDVETPDFQTTDNILNKKTMISICSFNTGYAGLDAGEDFFMDGGTHVLPGSKEQVESNINGISEVLDMLPADFYFLQEVDQDSSRSFHINQLEKYVPDYGSRVYARNYYCKWVPYPLPMIGKVDSGVMTLSDYMIESAERVQLPCAFSWPTSMYNLKRALLITRIPIEGSDKELVLINFHLEAYDDGEGKKLQKKALIKTLKDEYAKGNYVVAGGDFNQAFPKTTNLYPLSTDEKIWKPGKFARKDIPEGWSLCFDPSVPTCRSVDRAYTGEPDHQFYVIDGFLISPNVEMVNLMTVDFQFKYSDHNPIMIYINLLDE